jgi:hypothetical protein
MNKLKLYDLLQEVVNLKYSMVEVIDDYDNRHRSLWQEFMKSLSFREIKLIKGYINLCKLEKELVRLIKE